MDEPWIATTGKVTTCRYRPPGLSVLAFGIQTGEKFAITFDYYAHGRLFSDEFQSPVAVPQNEVITLSYNPLDPQQNSRTNHPSASDGRKPNPLFAFGIAGSVILSLLWLAILRGCR